MLYCFHAFLSLSLLPRVNEILFSLPCFSVNGEHLFPFYLQYARVNEGKTEEEMVEARVEGRKKDRWRNRRFSKFFESRLSPIIIFFFSRRVILSFYYRFAIQSRCRLMRYDSEYNGILAVTAAPITPTNLEIVISPRWRRRHRSIPNRSLADVNFDDYGSRCASSAQ